MITINDRRIVSVLDRLAGELQRPRALNAKVARHMRDYVKQTITLQGRGETYKPLSPLYKRQSGKFKALLGIRNRIFAEWDDNGAYVTYRKELGDQFTIKQLEQGWSQKPFEMPLKIRGARGRAYRKTMVMAGARNAKPIYFTRRKGFSVPGRKVWPSYLEAQREIKKVALEHYQDFVRAL
jgi:hypothetical protein